MSRRRARANVRSLVRPGIRRLVPPPYANPAGLRLDLNTNLFGPNPAIEETLRAVHRGDVDLSSYPSESALGLRAAYARTHGLRTEEVVAGNGADEVMDLITKTFAGKRERVVIPVPSFSMYAHYARVHDCRPVPVELGGGFALEPERFLSERGKITVLCRPNNPTANAFPPDDVAAVIEGARGIVLLDEAYVEFASRDLLRWVRRYPNLIITRTLSKAYGLAGLRVGLAVGDPAAIGEILKVKAPFNVGLLPEEVGERALSPSNRGWMRGVVAATKRERTWLRAELLSRGFRVPPSETNFLLVAPPDGQRDWPRRLGRRGIVVRDLNHQPFLRGYFRITVPPRELGRRFLAVVDSVGRDPKRASGGRRR